MGSIGHTLTLKQAQTYLKTMYQLNISTTRLRAWILSGLVSTNGRRYILRARKWFGLWHISDEAIDEFLSELGDPLSVYNRQHLHQTPNPGVILKP